MPNDIRSYFSKVDGKQDNPNKINSSSQKKNTKKRLILSSDEEDDVEPCGSVVKPQEQKSEKRICVNPVDVFGSNPVKQKPINVIRPPQKTQDNRMGEEIDIDWKELNIIEKQFSDVKPIDGLGSETSEKSISKSSDSTITTNTSPANLEQNVLAQKSSPNKFVSSVFNPSPNKNIQTLITPLKLKSPIKFPKKCESQKSTSSIKIISPIKQLNFNDNDKINAQSNFKRKISPTKTPENKKFKNNSVQSPDTQESGYSTELSPIIPTASPKLEEKVESKLWVEKYKPLKLNQIIGQRSEKSNVNKLLKWLESWYSNHGVGVRKKLSKPSPWAKNDNGAYFKAALLSGSPGVGKTTTAYLVCKELGFDIVEFNASDTRSKKQLQNHVSELLSSTSLSPFLDGNSVTKKHALLMDEVDGMAGNEDRGGLQELILLIKNAKCPILCMCNDQNNSKMRTLANYCFDLRFEKPKLELIKAAMMSICYKEKLSISSDTLSSIIASTDNDIRLTLNYLSIVAAGKNKFNANKKYKKMEPWDVVRKVFSSEEHKSMNMNDKFDLFFYDYNLSPLFIQENYLSVVPHIKGPQWKKLERYSLAADSISIGDIVNAKIRSTNNWNLLPTQAIFSSYCPGEFLSGHLSKRINFPAWLGKFSKGNKMNRLLQEVQIHSRIRLSASKEAINLDYLTILRDSILKPLLDEGSDGVQKSLDFMNHYHLVKNDVESLNELSLWPGNKNPMSDIPSQVKSAFTRMYNKSAPTFSVIKKMMKTVQDIVIFENGENNVISDEEDDDDVTNDALISTVNKKGASLPLTETMKGKINISRIGVRGGRKK